MLRAEGRGFNAGVDIKEMQQTTGFDALIGANRGCYAAFKAVYECAVPVIAAVNGHCLGGGVGLVGNADCIVASDDAYFGVPEVDRGALGAATHLARLVPPHLMRTLYFTGRTITAADLLPHGERARGGPARPARRRRAEGRRRDRRQGQPGDPGRQGGAQRHRPDRREQELPVRAGVHLRAQPVRGRATSCATTSRAPTGPSSDQGTPRQADDHRRGRRHARGRHHPRHRRLGAAAQADGAGPRDPPLRPQGPHPGQLGRRRRRPAGARRQGQEAGLRVRLARLGAARAELPARPARRAPSPRSSSSTRGCSRPGSTPPRSGCRSCRCAPGSAPTCWSTTRGSRR